MIFLLLTNNFSKFGKILADSALLLLPDASWLLSFLQSLCHLQQNLFYSDTDVLYQSMKTTFYVDYECEFNYPLILVLLPVQPFLPLVLIIHVHLFSFFHKIVQ